MYTWPYVLLALTLPGKEVKTVSDLIRLLTTEISMLEDLKSWLISYFIYGLISFSIEISAVWSWSAILLNKVTTSLQCWLIDVVGKVRADYKVYWWGHYFETAQGNNQNYSFSVLHFENNLKKVGQTFLETKTDISDKTENGAKNEFSKWTIYEIFQGRTPGPSRCALW